MDNPTTTPIVFTKEQFSRPYGDVIVCRNPQKELYRNDSLPCVEVRGGQSFKKHEIQPDGTIKNPVAKDFEEMAKKLPAGNLIFQRVECVGTFLTDCKDATGKRVNDERGRNMLVDSATMFGYNVVNDNGKCHSFNDEPAVYVEMPKGTLYERMWKKDGVNHRVNGPSTIIYNKDGTIQRESYALDGKYMTKEVWEAEVAKLKSGSKILA